jgi:predicted permease
MRRLRVLLCRLWGLFRKAGLERDLEDEFDFHLDMEIAENLRQGMSPADARRAALRRFGGVARAKEIYRETGSVRGVEILLQDVRYSLRMLRKRPGFTAAAVLSLALGIGATTAIFSVVDALLLKPLPYPDPGRLAILWPRSPGANAPREWFSPGHYVDIQTENHSFTEISISQGRNGILAGREQPERVEALRTSSNLFHLLGARPLFGRLLIADDDQPGKPVVVVLSYGIWKRLFSSDPKIVGKAILLNGLVNNGGAGRDKNQYTVVGVLRPEVQLNDEVLPAVVSIKEMEVFLSLPLAGNALTNRRGDKYYNLIARLKPGVTMSQAQADVTLIANRIRDRDKRDGTFTISVVPLLDQVVGNVRRTLLLMLGSAALVLLIACVNVANLLLSRAAGHQKEIAVRVALGAGRLRLVRQMLTESTLLGLMGGAAGVLIAEWSLYIVRTVNPGNIPRLEAIALDGGVLAFTFTISILTGLIFGLVPALRTGNVDLNSALKAGGRNTRGDGGIRTSRHRAGSLLVVSELAFSLILLIGAGLMIRSFMRLQSVPPGFNTDHVISMHLAGARSQDDLDQKVSRIPGVRAAGGVSWLPFTSNDYGWNYIGAEGFTPKPGEEVQADLQSATPGYFRTMEIPLLKGRFFTDRDAAPNTQPVVLVDEKCAQRFWPREDPIGKHVWIADPFARSSGNWREAQDPMTIVGVVGAVKPHGLDLDSRIVLYGPSIGINQYLVARTASDPALAAGAIVREIRALNPAIIVYDVRTMQDRMNDSLAKQRFSTVLLCAFAMFAMTLAAIGAYGVTSYLVTQSTHDIGVRIALGAQRGSILRLVVIQGLELAGTGIVAGIIGALALTRVMASLLFGVGPTDLMTFSGVPLILAAVALLATYLPARRATQVDPMVALREE